MQPQDAFECFVKASNVSQDSGDIWFNMAVLYEHCNQRQEASLAYQRAYSLDNTNALALERKNKLQANEDLENIPDFSHPAFELSEVPFTIKKNDKGLKPMKNLPDINKFKRDTNTSALVKKEEPSEDEESEEKSGESESKESSVYSPSAPDQKPKPLIHNEAKPQFAALPFSEMTKPKNLPQPANLLAKPAHPTTSPIVKAENHSPIVSNSMTFANSPPPPAVSNKTPSFVNPSNNPQGLFTNPNNQSAPTFPNMLNIPNIQNIPNLQNIPNAPTLQNIPINNIQNPPNNPQNLSSAQHMASMQNLPNVGNNPAMQGMSNLQNIPMQNMPPNMPNMANLPNMP